MVCRAGGFSPVLERLCLSYLGALSVLGAGWPHALQILSPSSVS